MSKMRMAAGLTILTLTATLSGCGGASSGPVGDGGRLQVVASFYPLQFVTQRVAGDLADVTSLTKPGAEPHDLELTPRDVGRISQADLVVYLSGFQSAVDEAVRTEPPKAVVDAARSGRLDLTYTPVEDGTAVDAEAGRTDPHFWLDPTRLADVTDAVAAELEKLRPADTATFQANAKSLRADLQTLDGEFETGLKTCVNKDLVTSHNAFGYLAQRYGLTQRGITGLTPEQEPDPGSLADIATFVKTHRVRTIYYETLVSPDIARVVASETGAATAVLDPIEGLNDRSAGKDYLQVMRADLATLKAGQPCP